MRQSTSALTLLALGVVYGDIGTSPLYAVKETFSPAHGIPLTPANILGGASAIFWALMLVVSLKYVTLVLRANNRGEGGQNAMSNDLYDALGLLRTQELLSAGRYYGVQQYWGSVIDYGFSKTTSGSTSSVVIGRTPSFVTRRPAKRRRSKS